MQLKVVLQEAARRLRDGNFPTPLLDAEVLLTEVLKVEKTFLYSHPDYELTEDEKWRYEILLERRLRQEPVAYIIGKKEFWSRLFKVDRRVLIPRPETETLVQAALDLARGFIGGELCVLDVGTGSGAIGITLAAELEGAKVVATDISPDALAVAAENARSLGVREKMDFVASSGLEAISGFFHLILSNPPYIPSNEIINLPPGVRDYEPIVALDGGKVGIDVHLHLVEQARECLFSGGWLIMEVGDKQAPYVLRRASDVGGYDTIRVICDYLGQERVVAMRKA